jgi:two-component system NtrC family sensor kinase
MSGKVRTNSSHKPSALEELQGLFQVVSEGKRIWEATFDAIVDPVMIISKKFIIERANLAAAKSAQVHVRDLIGNHCYEVFAKRDSPCLVCPLQVSLKKSAPETSRLQPYADDREFVVSGFPIKGKQGENLELAVLQYQDLSAIRKLEEQLLQNEKMAALGIFASGIAHDINNPLSGVLAFAQLAMKDLDPENPTYKDLKEIEVSALRCKKIVEDLLSFARPTSKTDKNTTDLGQLIERVLPSLEVQWKDFNYSMKLELKELTPVSVCENKLEQVFTNILTNALQALAPGGAICIRGGEDDKSVFIEVQDNGKGIAKHHLNSIFDPYFTTKREGGGMGLGLPICYNIVREHGGNIEVKSTLGKGTTFRVYVPKGRSDETPSHGS